MTVTIPLELRNSAPITGDIPGSEFVVQRDELRSVRLYSRLAAALAAGALVLAASVAFWLSIRLFGRQWDPGQTVLAWTAVSIVAAMSCFRAELRLRSYRLEVTADAVIFEYGRKRSYVPREHVQLLDIESSILLRVFRLKRCSLHTGGGTVVVSPVPAEVASAVERLISVQPATRRTGGNNAGS